MFNFHFIEKYNLLRLEYISFEFTPIPNCAPLFEPNEKIPLFSGKKININFIKQFYLLKQLYDDDHMKFHLLSFYQKI